MPMFKQCVNQFWEISLLIPLLMKSWETGTIWETTWKTTLKINSKVGVFGCKLSKSQKLPSPQTSCSKIFKLNSDKTPVWKQKRLIWQLRKRSLSKDKNPTWKLLKSNNLTTPKSNKQETIKEWKEQTNKPCSINKRMSLKSKDFKEKRTSKSKDWKHNCWRNNKDLITGTISRKQRFSSKERPKKQNSSLIGKTVKLS